MMPNAGRFSILVCSFFLAVYSTLLVTARTAAAATEVAKVNDHIITLDEFQKYYKESLKFFQFRTPTKKGVLDDLIKRQLGLQEARRLGLDKDPVVIERINTVLFNALLDKKLTSEFEKIHVSDEEAKSFYAKNPELRTSQLFVSLKPDANAKDKHDAMERIRKMESEVKAGKSFAEVAQQLSDGPTAAMGGDMEFQTRERLDPAYYEAALKLKAVGKMSGVVETPFGLHVIKLTGIRDWEQADTAAVKRNVLGQRKVELFDKYMRDLRQKAKVATHEELLKD